MNGNEQFLGLVQNGAFKPLTRQQLIDGSLRLTTIGMQEARPPETGEINLTEYEGQAILVCGHGGGGGWVYSAGVIDRAGAILTMVVQQVFGLGSKIS